MKPLLATALPSIDDAILPAFCSYKYDGIRCLVIEDPDRPTRRLAVSRKLKPIPNTYIRTSIEAVCPIGFDGEIIVPGMDFNEVQSVVMTITGATEFEFHVFDYVPMWSNPDIGFFERFKGLQTKATQVQKDDKRIKVVEQRLLSASADLEAFEVQCVEQGYEGAMLRGVRSIYKYGRSTLKEAILLKLKRFKDEEAEVIGFEELQHNDNPAMMDALGHTKRSSHKANKRGGNTLGKLIGKTKDGREVHCSGFTAKMREEIWNNQPGYLGRKFTFKHQPSGAKDKFRFPTFKGFRHEDDM